MVLHFLKDTYLPLKELSYFHLNLGGKIGYREICHLDHLELS